MKPRRTLVWPGRIRPTWLRRIVLLLVIPFVALLFVVVNVLDTARALAKVVADEAQWQWIDTLIQARRLMDALRARWTDE